MTGRPAARDGARPSAADAAEFEALRPYLFVIAYRMLGSATDAEDAVQEAYLRAASAGDAAVRSPKAYFAAVVTRLCLDHLKSARVARETYLGPWLPEPVPTADALSPAEVVERRDEVSLAFLHLLERLTPEERAVYVLREAFDVPYGEIAGALEKSVPACRQLGHRARVRLEEAGAPRFSPAPEEHRRLTERFFAAAWRGDLGALMDALATDATLWTDGGTKARAARRPIAGRDAVARWLVGVVAKTPAGARPAFAEINGGAGIVLWSGDDLIAAVTIRGAAGRVAAVHAVVNSDKLAYLRRRLANPDAPTASDQPLSR